MPAHERREQCPAQTAAWEFWQWVKPDSDPGEAPRVVKHQPKSQEWFYGWSLHFSQMRPNLWLYRLLCLQHTNWFRLRHMTEATVAHWTGQGASSHTRHTYRFLRPPAEQSVRWNQLRIHSLWSPPYWVLLWRRLINSGSYWDCLADKEWLGTLQRQTIISTVDVFGIVILSRIWTVIKEQFK